MLTKKDVNAIAAAAFGQVKEVLKNEWDTLPVVFSIYEYVDLKGNHSFAAKALQTAYDRNEIASVTTVYKVNKQTKQAFYVGRTW